MAKKTETTDDRILKLVEDTTLTKAEFDAELAMHPHQAGGRVR